MKQKAGDDHCLLKNLFTVDFLQHYNQNGKDNRKKIADLMPYHKVFVGNCAQIMGKKTTFQT